VSVLSVKMPVTPSLKNRMFLVDRLA